MKPVILHNSTFYNGDCIRGAARYIPDNSVDLIITDPPYGINGDNFTGTITGTRILSLKATSRSRRKSMQNSVRNGSGKQSGYQARRVDLHRLRIHQPH